ncbi:hypothetical protein ABZ883_34570 [Streptomyces sp. NPDC046977]|uniref:hypothetical protein n=1 Tax=Streptomyces sp. NPDC046977 TaxID=3154703 RepID=UPI0033ECEFAB
MRSRRLPGPGTAVHGCPVSPIIGARRTRQATPADAVRTPSLDQRALPPQTSYRGRTTVEAARVPGISPGTVTSRTYDALHDPLPAPRERRTAP